MQPVKKRILVDENQAPIAVQIDYQDWLQIEQALTKHQFHNRDLSDITPLKGSLRLTEDPLAFQQRIRGEW